MSGGWLLLAAPSIVMMDVWCASALAGAVCGRELHVVHHVSHAMTLILIVSLILLALQAQQRFEALMEGAVLPPEDASAGRAGFFSRLGAWAAWLSLLVLISAWIPVWVMAPCVS